MANDDIIICRLCEKLEEEHGYRFEKSPCEGLMTPQVARECLEELRAPSAVSGFYEFVHRETDLGRAMENDARLEALIGDIGKLTMAGALPKVIPRQDGLFKQVMDGLFRGSMSPEEARLLGELRAHGERRALYTAEGWAVPTPEQAALGVRNDLEDWAHEKGLVIPSFPSLDQARAMPVEELLELLLVSDPNDGLSDTQELFTKVHKPGLQGIMRDSYENDNRRADYDALVAAGVLPVIENAPIPEGTSFVGRIFKKATRAISSVPATEDLPALTELGRNVLRAVLHERAPELAAQNQMRGPSA